MSSYLFVVNTKSKWLEYIHVLGKLFSYFYQRLEQQPMIKNATTLFYHDNRD